jgi:hypothetical protein
MNRILCFFIEKTPVTRYYLRRYSHEGCLGDGMSYHNAKVHLMDTEEKIEAPLNNDPRWPVKCDYCDFRFVKEDYQLFQDWIYRRQDNGEQVTLMDAPVGAMWYADWFNDIGWTGPDGRCLVVKTPGGDWIIDHRANNCTMPNDYVHRCWIREGIPPKITVGKNGNTCAAGAGSILIGGYHGFLRGGFLEEC